MQDVVFCVFFCRRGLLAIQHFKNMLTDELSPIDSYLPADATQKAIISFSKTVLALQNF